MKLSSRFALDILFVLAGAFLTVTAMSFTAPVAGWIAFGVFTGLAVLALATSVFARRTSQRIGHAVIGLVALWSLVAALGVAALADLTAHEIAEEHVVHRLEVTQATGAAA
jgi:bacteriorhodopsin